MSTSLHRIRISSSFPRAEKYASWLSSSELVSGVDTVLTFTVKNEGQTTFPGGRITSFRILAYGTSIGTGGLAYDVDLNTNEVPQLKQNDSYQLKTRKFTPYLEGVLWYDLRMSANDGGKIDCYVETSTTPAEYYMAYMIIVNRFQLDMLNTLDRLISSKSGI